MKATARVVITMVLFAVGCETTRTGGFEIAFCENAQVADAVTVDDRRFAADFSIGAVAVRREDSGFIRVQTGIRNRTRKDVPVQYKFVFFDSDGMEVQAGARGWEQTILHGGEQVRLEAVAPDKTAERGVVRVRRTL